MLIDTHFHLDLMENMQSLIRGFQTSEIGVIAVGTTPKAYMRETYFCTGVRNIKVGLGLHPQLVEEREQEIELFLRLMDGCRYIGEIGLDFNSASVESKEKQMAFFKKTVKACTDEGDKVLSIHSVKAAEAMMDALESAGTFRNNICILHWFTGTTAGWRRAIENDAWFSINPMMLRTKKGQETIKAIPLQRMLLETDAPFTMKVGSVEVLSEELDKLVAGISAIRGENVNGQIQENSAKLFSGKL